MTHKQAREAILRIIKAPINKNEHEGLYVTTSDICINKLVSTKLGEVAYEIDKILEKYIETKKPSNVYAISGDKLTLLRESNELKVFDIDGQVYSVLIGDIDQYIEQKILEAKIGENEQALYIYQNQVSDFYALAGAIAGADKDLSKGIFVEYEDGKTVVTADGVNFKLPQFFEDRIADLKSKLAKIKEAQQ